MRSSLLALAALSLALAPALHASVSSADALAARAVDMGGSTFEPTLGVDAEGRIFYSMTPVRGIAIGFGTGVWRSDDAGATWSDVSPRVAGVRAPPETNDPYVYVDPTTGRVFQFAMAPILVCSIMSFSDDQGASWVTNARGCGNPGVWDHQTMVASKPRVLTPVGYPNVLLQCVNQVTHIGCARSLDGGLSWTPSGNVPSAVSCGGLHGHLKAAPDGTLYLPRVGCGAARVFTSVNDGITWSTRPIATDAIDGPDPTLAVDDAGNAYFAYVDLAGRLKLSVSTNGGATWSVPVVVSPPGVTANLPAAAAGADGRVVIAYAGTDDLPLGYRTPGYFDPATVAHVEWFPYMQLSLDARAAGASWSTLVADKDDDPIVRGACGPGRCPGMVDFIDAVVGPDGAAYAAFVDACTGACATTPGEGNKASRALLVTLDNAPALR